MNLLKIIYKIYIFTILNKFYFIHFKCLSMHTNTHTHTQHEWENNAKSLCAFFMYFSVWLFLLLFFFNTFCYSTFMYKYMVICHVYMPPSLKCNVIINSNSFPMFSILMKTGFQNTHTQTHTEDNSTIENHLIFWALLLILLLLLLLFGYQDCLSGYILQVWNLYIFRFYHNGWFQQWCHGKAIALD